MLRKDFAMPSSTKNREYHKNLYIGGPNGSVLARTGLGVTGGTGTKVARHSRQLCHEKVDLQAVAGIAITNAQKFNGFKALTFPNTNLLVLGWRLVLAATISTTAGGTANVGTDFNFALGSVTTASANFANAGEKSYMDSHAGVGAAQALTLNGNSAHNASPAVAFIAAGASNAAYINIGTAATVDSTHPQTITFGAGSLLDVWYYDLDLGA